MCSSLSEFHQCWKETRVCKIICIFLVFAILSFGCPSIPEKGKKIKNKSWNFPSSPLNQTGRGKRKERESHNWLTCSFHFSVCLGWNSAWKTALIKIATQKGVPVNIMSSEVWEKNYCIVILTSTYLKWEPFCLSCQWNSFWFFQKIKLNQGLKMCMHACGL